ncbi:hypothetical protein ACLOJK_018808 [Asimina triloba]
MGHWLDAGGRLLLVGIKSVMEMGHAGSMMEKLDNGGAIGARGVIVVLLRGVDGRTDLLSGVDSEMGFNPSRLGVMGCCPSLDQMGCLARFGRLMDAGGGGRDEIGSAANENGEDAIFGFWIFMPWMSCCSRTMMGSSSACLPRHFGWLGSSVRITAGKLAAGSHGCRPW